MTQKNFERACQIKDEIEQIDEVLNVLKKLELCNHDDSPTGLTPVTLEFTLAENWAKVTLTAGNVNCMYAALETRQNELRMEFGRL